ncbi:5-bromo-4-chloroindolyl phosphate hydrolysis family protein [Pectobacterium polaris]|uniref:5-bromo-4-chloroindolyl phosphate hydrolysis family protein n=1 Tax=Pectobacterium polaris TaxID=2042057 RepID=UPI001CF258BB|nr:5-bromo-4-chloroindolyl phosphate hydrolysis family protein [Pectobacterium polaris]MCA6943645.1 5-bromo-4-chloroindolyl phosphate hydrolysis family protein [Pectobacterium polaris]MCA6959203.1 5-bromo-4-chloroindolyl phosphate hydrolysis family protein [Pectobacterium polaris]
MQNASSPPDEGWQKKLGRLCLTLFKLWGLVCAAFIVSAIITMVFLDKLYPDLMADENVQTCVFIVNAFSLILLWYAFTRPQVDMIWPLVAGVIWFIAHDALFVLGWIAAAWWIIKVCSEISHPRLGTAIQFLLVFIIIMGYTDVHQFGEHPFYNTAFATCIVLGAMWHYQGKTAFKTRKNQPKGQVAVLTPKSPQPSPSVITPSVQEVVTFESRIARLQNLQPLPNALLDELKIIVEYGQLIVTCMKEDPKDVEPGTAFLNRYLPAVEKMAGEFARLSTQLEKHGKSDDFLLKNVTALKALGSAFQQQHARLLENDTLDFDTELNLVNNLLKTDGYK